MMKDRLKFGVFSAFVLKILACLFMVVDHVGLAFFEQCEWMRIVGRLAYPLFAFFIAEGCRYTKNKLRRFLSVFVLAVVCETAFAITYGYYVGNILLTFSISILIIYLLQYSKKEYLKSKQKGILYFIAFVLSVALVFVFCEHVGVVYGFFGVLAPVAITLFDDVSVGAEKTYENPFARLLSYCVFSITLLLMSLYNPALGDIQLWCLLSVPILLLYNGKKGRYSFKYGFYIFYPLHLLIIQGILMLT